MGLWGSNAQSTTFWLKESGMGSHPPDKPHIYYFGNNPGTQGHEGIEGKDPHEYENNK
jgi:hypothetical protein